MRVASNVYRFIKPGDLPRVRRKADAKAAPKKKKSVRREDLTPEQRKKVEALIARGDADKTKGIEIR